MGRPMVKNSKHLQQALLNNSAQNVLENNQAGNPGDQIVASAESSFAALGQPPRTSQLDTRRTNLNLIAIGDSQYADN